MVEPLSGAEQAGSTGHCPELELYYIRSARCLSESGHFSDLYAQTIASSESGRMQKGLQQCIPVWVSQKSRISKKSRHGDNGKRRSKAECLMCSNNFWLNWWLRWDKNTRNKCMFGIRTMAPLRTDRLTDRQIQTTCSIGSRETESKPAKRSAMLQDAEHAKNGLQTSYCLCCPVSARKVTIQMETVDWIPKVATPESTNWSRTHIRVFHSIMHNLFAKADHVGFGWKILLAFCNSYLVFCQQFCAAAQVFCRVVPM